MQAISLPFRERDFKVRNTGMKNEIWDVCRKRYVMLTQEEYVRQHLLSVLIEDLQYPKGLISVEKWISVGKLRKRYDIIVYDSRQQPFILIECKAPVIALDESVIMQALNYLNKIQSPYFMISNGSLSFLARIDGGSVIWQHDMPLLP